ncbi:MAG: glycosyltransferase family 4 protein [Dokdonella sp.]|nr:glycosyltransferase family 4 protein [Dokdonella sp.]
MRVLMVATSYPANLGDWRGLFIRHVADALARRGDTHLSLWAPPGEVPANARYVATRDEAHWLAQLMQAGGVAHLMRTQGVRGLATPLGLLRMLRSLYVRETDIDALHVNWLQNAIALPRNRIPLLVTVLGSDLALLRLPGMAALLRRVFRGRRVFICPNAAWMVPQLKQRFGDLAQVRHVPFGIDPCWYAVEHAPASPSRWLCVSRLTKGKIGTLFAWGEAAFAGTNRELHLFGPMQEEMEIPDWVHYHGPASPKALCEDWFPTARGLVSLSAHAEGLPQVMLEAMAAGLPILASRIAAHEDLLQHESTGWLCGSADDFAAALDALDEDALGRKVGQRAHDFVRTRVGTWDDCAARYADIHRELVAS